MKDLIRRSDAKELFELGKSEWKDYEAAHEIEQLPAVDAVEVCRCADCVHFEPFRQHDGFCKINGMLYDNEFYCKDGQRREDGDNGKHL